MKIGFDGRYAEGDLVGVGKYIKSLVLELAGIGVHCVIFYSKIPKHQIIGGNIEMIVLPRCSKIVFEQIYIPLYIKRLKINLYHACGGTGVPLLFNTKTILTIHDMIPMQIKDYFSYSRFPFFSKSLYYLRLYISVNTAEKIITVSKYTKLELEKRGMGLGKIYVIYSGVNVFPKQHTNENTYGKYILNNGGLDIRKNIDRLIIAFSEVHKEFPYHKLLITGENVRLMSSLIELVNKRGLEKIVIFTGYIKEEEMGYLIKNAKCLCYPSLIEGFGFPVLEAFSFGVPVVASNTSSIPEIADGAAILVDPHSYSQISAAIIKILKNNSLSIKLKKLGLKQIKNYSWKKSANEYLNLYNSIK